MNESRVVELMPDNRFYERNKDGKDGLWQVAMYNPDIVICY